RHHQRLSFTGERGHFFDDRLLLTAIQTQGLLLPIALGVAPSRALVQRQTVFRNLSILRRRDRHLRWLSPIKRTRVLTSGLGWPSSHLEAHHTGRPRFGGQPIP